MSAKGTIELATRGSDLALRQAAQVQSRLADQRIDADLREVETQGDRIEDALIQDLGKTGAFVRELDRLVMDEEVDGAVHSMKDVPTEEPAKIVIAAVPSRGPVEDVLVTPDGDTLAELPQGAIVGTSSLRRGAQVRARRPDLEIEPLRGNVDTRVEKVLAPSLQAEHEIRLEAAASESDVEAPDDRSPEEWFDSLSEVERGALGREVDTAYDAIVLAKAGLVRSSLLDAVSHVELPVESHVPAAGQGALAIAAHGGSEVAEAIHAALDHPPTRVATTVERVVLAELGAGCVAPLGIHATVQGDVVRTTVQVLSRDGSEEVRETRALDVEQYENEARQFASELADRGAAELIAEAKRE
ncbi:MAG: hydroxymethylbilane synthase [Halodesulfurarchaeum sp.]